jgi:hypothetical protein
VATGPPPISGLVRGAALGLFGLLLALQLAAPPLDADQAVTGLMGLHVLRGELPVYFWRQHHAGVPESYGAAVTFAVLGVSRFALSLVPAAAAVGLALTVYRTGMVLFGPAAGVLAILFITVVGPYTASHYVAARAYYVEHLLLGQLLLLGAALWLRHGATAAQGARGRILLAMGLAGGLGLYCGFQIAGPLLPAVLTLVLIDPRLPWRREAWVGAGAFLVGSAPFWFYNLTNDWATIGIGVRFQGRQSGHEAARVIASELLPTVLGVTEYVGTPPFLPGPWSMLPVLMAGASVLWLAARAVLALPRLRRDSERAGEALLVVTIASVIGLVWYGRYTQVPRYLLPLAPVLALVLARAVQLVGRRSRAVAVVAASLYLLPVAVGLASELTALSPTRWAAYWAGRADDARLVEFLASRGLTRAYAFEYWHAPRLTFEAAERVIVATPYAERHAPYVAAVDATPDPAYVLRGSVPRFENWLTGLRVRAERDTVGSYTVFWKFRPPPPTVPIARRGWRVAVTEGQGHAGALTDGRLDSRWVSAPGPDGSAAVLVDLGERRRLSGVVLIGGAARLPQTLEVAATDGTGEVRRLARIDVAGFSVDWRNGGLRAGPGRAVVARFGPVAARTLRLTDLGPGGTWAVSELFLLAPAGEPIDVATAGALLEEGQRLEATGPPGPALLRYHQAMIQAPDDPDGYAAFARLVDQVAGRLPSTVAQATWLAGIGLAEAARSLYADLAAAADPEGTQVWLTRRRLELALRDDDAAEAARLRAELAEAEAARLPAGAVFGRVAELVDYAVSPPRVRPGEAIELTLRWRVRGGTRRAGELVSYAHARGEHLRFGDDRPLPRPVPGLAAGLQDVVERRRMTIPANAPPGPYRLVVGVWNPSTGERLRRWWHGILPTRSHVVELGTFEVLSPS